MYISKKEKVTEVTTRIQQSVSISRALDDLFDNTAVKGNRYRCPFHDDKTPSMFVDKTDMVFNCFSGACKRGGKVTTLIYLASQEGIITNAPELNYVNNYEELLLRVANYFHVPIPYKNMEGEFGDGSVLEHVEYMLSRVDSIDTPTDMDKPTLKMRFRDLKRDYNKGKIDIDQLMDVFAFMQHEAVENPSTLDEIYVTAFSALSKTITLDDLMGGDLFGN